MTTGSTVDTYLGTCQYHGTYEVLATCIRCLKVTRAKFMTPAQRVSRLVAYLGSDDKLAAKLNDRFGTAANRQTTIRWRYGGAISRAKHTGHHYAELLAELDVEIFQNGATAEDYDTSPSAATAADSRDAGALLRYVSHL